MQDIASAIRFLTEEMIDGERKRVLHNHLRTVPEEDFRHDIHISKKTGTANYVLAKLENIE